MRLVFISFALIFALASAQKPNVRGMVSTGRWTTCAVGPKVSEHWAEQRRAAERAVEGLRRMPVSERSKALAKFGRSLSTYYVSAEDAYLAVHYMRNFKADIERLEVRAIYGFTDSASKTVGTRDPEFLRSMYIGLTYFHGYGDFGPSIGTGLVKVFPNDIQVKETFVRDHAIINGSLGGARAARKYLREDLAEVWTVGKVAQHEALLQSAVLLHTKKESDMNLAIQLWKKAVELDPSVRRTAETYYKIYKSRYDRGKIIKGT